jgi:tetratricopeptide (TPR) repeat protein
VRLARAGLFIVALALALVPEMGRYAAERTLYRVTAELRVAAIRGQAVGDAGEALGWSASAARGAAASLPGDWRPSNAEGAALLLAGRADDAAQAFRRGLALGERPEIDLNLGRAYAALGRLDEARAAVLRATWVSPAVLDAIGRDTRDRLLTEVDRLAEELSAGRLAAPPPLP